VVKAMWYLDGRSNCCRGCFSSRYGGGAARGRPFPHGPKSTDEFPPRSWGITFIVLTVHLSIIADLLYPAISISYCFFCLSCFSSRPRLVYKSSLSLFSMSAPCSGEATTHVFWPFVSCLPSIRSRDSSMSPMWPLKVPSSSSIRASCSSRL
jgi:hypothetical protein